MLNTLFTSIVDKYRQPNSRIVLALSGGVDSRVLLHLLANYERHGNDVNCVAVHVHHGLSQNADQWAEQCLTWCHEYGVKLHVERVQLNLANQISTEQEARNQRYKALEKHINNGDLLLTAQHSGDQLETFLLAMKRGSGPKGLSSMPECIPFSSGILVRPLLSVSQELIITYANEKNLDWIEDESNLDTQYDRNFLRHEVIPKLKCRWPSLEQSVLRTSKLCAAQELLISELLQERLNAFTHNDNGISIPDLSQQSELVRNQLLRLWLQSKQSLMPSLKQLVLIWEEVALARKDANPRVKITSGEIRRFKDRLYFIGCISDITLWSAPILQNIPVELPDNLGKIKLVNKVSYSSLSLRAPKRDEKVWVHFNPQGLSAHPKGREHHRKLKKLFQEYEIPSWLRTRTPIIMYDDNLAMVADVFVCKDFCGDDCEIIWDKV